LAGGRVAGTVNLVYYVDNGEEKIMTIITLNLPEKTIIQAKHAAAILNRSVEEVLVEMLTAVLPSVQDAPEALQAELAGMTWMDNKALWTIARSAMPQIDQDRMRQLSEMENRSESDEQELENLRNEYGRITLIKSRAYAILSLRGGKPILQ
jgi:hypothetical protein